MVKASNLGKKYKNDWRWSLKGVNLVLKKGRVYGLFDLDGSGNTSFMKIIAGLEKPTEGSITFNDKPIGMESRKNVAYISAKSYFYPSMTIKDVGEYFAAFYEDFSMEKYEEMLDAMNLYMGEKVSNLSLGQEVKFKVSLILSRDALLYILDGPFMGVDIIARDKILETIQDMVNEERTFIISDYSVDILEKLIDEVIFLKEGSVVLAGDVKQIKIEHRKTIVELYKEIYA